MIQNLISNYILNIDAKLKIGSNMICETCGKEHTGSYGSGRFCNATCARKYSTLNDNSTETKLVKCIKCGNEFEVNKRSDPTKAICLECKKATIRCNLCGAKHNECKRPDICKRKRMITGTLAKYFGFNLDTLGTDNVYKEFDRIKAIVQEMYLDHSLAEICNIVGYESGPTNLWNLLKILKLEYRNSSDAQRLAILKGRANIICNPTYAHGWHITWNNKKVYYRSSYELDYCKQLDEQQIDYEMESLRIEYWDNQLQCYRIAVPDFHLLADNVIAEIKSDWTYDEQNMRDRFNAYKKLGYKTKLILEHEEILL